MTAKKINAKDFLINNGIIVVVLLLAVFTAIKQPTFFSGGNFINIALNVAPRFIIACGVSGCLITKGTDLSAGRMVGLSACLAGTLLQKPDYSGKFFQNLPDFGNAWGLWVLAVLLICVVICCIFGFINGIVISYLQVPAVIGTDYQALKRMCEKKTDLPILAIDTDGMELYDKGEEKAYLALFTAFAKEKYEVCKEKVGILGMTPQDVSDLKAADKVREELKKEGKEAICYGMGDGLEAVERASEVGKNIVVSAAALEAAKYLEKTFGTPYEIGYPAAGELVPNLDYQGKKILVVHQQVMAEAIRQEILKRENSAEVQTATWFMRKKELACPQDVSLREEDDYIDLVKNGGFDIIFADACMEKMVPDFQGIFVNT